MKKLFDEYWRGNSLHVQSLLMDIDELDEKINKATLKKVAQLMVILSPMLITIPITFISGNIMIGVVGASISGGLFAVDKACEFIKQIRRDLGYTKPVEKKEENFREIDEEEVNAKKSNSYNRNNTIGYIELQNSDDLAVDDYNVSIDLFFKSIYSFLKNRGLEEHYYDIASRITRDACTNAQINEHDYVEVFDLIKSLDLMDEFVSKNVINELKNGLFNKIPNCTIRTSDIIKMQLKKDA